MPGDPNFTSGAIIAYNGDSERGWNDPPTLSFNSNSPQINSNRRGKLDLRKRIAHDQAIPGTGNVLPPSVFPPKGINNDLCKGVANLGITDPRLTTNQSPLPHPGYVNGYNPIQTQPASFYHPMSQQTATTSSLPAYPIPSVQAPMTHPMHAASMSVIPQTPYNTTPTTHANNLSIHPSHHASFHRVYQNLILPILVIRLRIILIILQIYLLHLRVRSTADLVSDNDHAASHIGQPLVRTYNPSLITPLIPIPPRQLTPPVIKPLTPSSETIPADNRTPYNSPQIVPSSGFDHHEHAARSSSPGVQPYLLTGPVSRSESTSPAPPPPHGTPPLSRSEGSSPRSSSPKANEEFLDDGKSEEERRDVTMEILIQVLETHRESLKKSADDISRKLELMNTKWSSGKLSETAQRRLFKLAKALQEHDHDEAHKVHLSIVVDHVSEVNQFMVAIKKLVAVSKSFHNGAVL